MSKILLAVSGAARAGKDTLAKTIQAFLPNTVRMAFADAVKEEAEPICQSKFGLSAWTQDPAEKKIVRPVLIDIGHGRRQDNPTIWIDKIADKIDAALPVHNVIITDCRYKNEADMVHRKGGLVIFIKRDTQDNNIPTEQETLPLIPYDILIDMKSADTNALVRRLIPGFTA